jgi:valyl-tRNA synthetase
MVEVLAASLQLLHPLMPFITEEIWQKLPSTHGSIMVSSYPRYNPEKIDEDAEAKMSLIIEVVNSVRNIRWEMNVSPSQMVEVVLLSHNSKSLEILAQYKMYIENLARANRITITQRGERPRAAATAVAQDVEIFLPLEGIIDFTEEEKRLQKEIAKIDEELVFLTKKLANENFLSRAPEAIIEKERLKTRELREKRDTLEEGLNRIKKFILEAR